MGLKCGPRGPLWPALQAKQLYDLGGPVQANRFLNSALLVMVLIIRLSKTGSAPPRALPSSPIATKQFKAKQS